MLGDGVIVSPLLFPVIRRLLVSSDVAMLYGIWSESMVRCRASDHVRRAFWYVRRYRRKTIL